MDEEDISLGYVSRLLPNNTHAIQVTEKISTIWSGGAYIEGNNSLKDRKPVSVATECSVAEILPITMKTRWETHSKIERVKGDNIRALSPKEPSTPSIRQIDFSAPPNINQTDKKSQTSFRSTLKWLSCPFLKDTLQGPRTRTISLNK